jgi:hypothetical protein
MNFDVCVECFRSRVWLRAQKKQESELHIDHKVAQGPFPIGQTSAVVYEG